MKSRLSFLCVALLSAALPMNAQIMSGATNMIATEVPHTTIPYRIEDQGTKLPDITWGLDLAWISEGNLARGVNYAGKEMIDIVRLSFQTTAPVTDGTLSQGQKDTLDMRIGYVKKWTPNTPVNLNSDQEAGVLSWYHVYQSEKKVSTYAPRWAALIAATKKYVESKGLTVASVSPFNEPDYGEGQTWGWHQGSKAEMKEICRLLREDATYANDFKDVKLCGGNTLNCDPAWDWYNYSKDYLDEGNTHQLAGSFDNFAAFYQKVKADGKVGVGDELHNTMECMVGSEYGLTKGIWWGTCEHTRSQFMKASRGKRLGYAENRARWTAGSVYRHADGYREGCDVQGFVGTSERQAGKTTFRFAALDHDVFYNGVGPTREYIVTTPGWPNGAGYDSDEEHHCTNAEGLVNIQSGDDIMPALPMTTGTYRIVNRLSGFSLAPHNNAVEQRKNLVQIKNAKNNQAQQWIITPDSVSVGGDFTNYLFACAKNKNLYPDVDNWSLLDKGTIMLYPGGRGDNEKWFFEYAGDGYFYIRSKHSGLYLQTEPDVNGQPATETQMKASGRIVNQGVFTGKAHQQWKLIDITDGDIALDSKAPAAPTALTTTPLAASVRLEWTAPNDKDLKHYIVLRSTDKIHWNTIHHQVVGTSYIDNTVDGTTPYYYKVQAVDMSLNRSADSEVVSAAATGAPSCIMHIACDSLSDATLNGNHVALYGPLKMKEAAKIGQGITLVPKSSNFLQLPATVANSKELTVCMWILYHGGANRWQRLFDFGTDTDHYVFLTPSNGDNFKMRLAIKNGGSEQKLETSSPSTTKWTHVAVTFGTDQITLYVNGKAVATSTSIQDRPADFRPVFNYIGRSQFAADPFLNSDIDDARIYNYSLTAEEIAAIADLTDVVTVTPDVTRPAANSVYDLSGRQVLKQRLPRGVYVIGGKTVRIQ